MSGSSRHLCGCGRTSPRTDIRLGKRSEYCLIQDVGGTPEKTFLRCLHQTHLLSSGPSPKRLLPFTASQVGRENVQVRFHDRPPHPEPGPWAPCSSAPQPARADLDPDRGAHRPPHPPPHDGAGPFAERKSQQFMRLAAGRPRYTAFLACSAAGSHRHTVTTSQEQVNL